MFDPRSRLAGLVVVAMALGPASTAWAASYQAGFEERVVVAGLSTPTAAAWTPDGRVLVVEKDGLLKVAAPGSSTATTILDLRSRVNSYWDRGLLGLAVDSSFASNRYVYLLYTYELDPLNPDAGGRMVSRLTRVQLNPDNSVSPETVVLGSYVAGPCPAPSQTVDCIPSDGLSHSIGSVRSAPDGSLYVGSGDAASFAEVDPLALRTYNEATLAGKIMRVDRNGRGLGGHPFCPTQTDLTRVCTKLWAKGFRNPFRFELRPSGTGLTVGDVGWYTREEIDLISSGGRSYGWPCYEGTIRGPGYQNMSECAAEYAKEGTPNAHVGPQWDYPHNDASAAALGGPTYTGSAYPSSFRDTVFVGDYSTGRVRRLELDTQGRVSAVRDFASDWFGVQLLTSPQGDIAYVNIGYGPGTGSVQRFAYTLTNRDPVARANGVPDSGPSPLTVRFDGRWSTDPDGDALTHQWTFGDGASASGPTPEHTYTAAGTYTARLTVSDGRGGSASATVPVSVGNERPSARIESPADGATFRAGDQVTLRGSATDPQDGTLGAAAFSWDVTLHHGTHTHPVSQPQGVTQTTFTTTTDHDADSYYEITLRVTDSAGLTGTASSIIRPQTVPFTLASSPAGAPTSYGGQSITAPATLTSAVGHRTTVTAAQSFAAGGQTYLFDRWSDGGARLHTITIPATASTLTAVYAPQATAPPGGPLPPAAPPGPSPPSARTPGGTSAPPTGAGGSGLPTPANRPPQVTLAAAPATTAPRRLVTFTATPSDTDGAISRVAFDLNGDGAFERDATPAGTLLEPGPVKTTQRFASPGKRTVRVRAIDDRGATGFGTARVVVRSFTVTGKARRGQKLADIRKRGLKASMTCPAGCRLRAALVVDARSAQRLGISARRKATEVGVVKVDLTAGLARTLRVKPSARLGAKLRRISKLTLSLKLIAKDDVSNRAARTVGIRLSTTG